MNRDEFMKYIYDEFINDPDNYRANRIIDAIDEYVESIKQSERKKGTWVPKVDQRYYCSGCDEVAPKGIRWNFCPNCGAEMKGEQE